MRSNGDRCLSAQTSVTVLFHVKLRSDKAAALLWLQAREWGVDLNAAQLDLLRQYADILFEYKLANIIGAQTRDEALLDHIADALTCYLTGQLGKSKKLVDIGTGGGLPGIPLQIICSGLQVTLLDSTTKKTRFLDSVVTGLGLCRTRIVNERAEEAGRQPGFRNTFDVAVARAVGPLPTVLEYSAPLVKSGGMIIAMKGRLLEEEMKAGDAAAQTLGLKIKKKINVDYRPDMVQKNRTLLLYRKESETPNRFPRRVGLAHKRPISHKGKE